MKPHPLRAWCMVCHAWQPLDHTSEDCAQAVHDRNVPTLHLPEGDLPKGTP